MRIFTCLFLAGMICLATSCRVQKRTFSNYLENVADTTLPIQQNIPDPLIQKNDILSIRVYSMSINPATDIPYNLPEQAVAGGSGTTTAGFLVDQNGNIEYPRIGTIHAEGLTKEQLSDTIKDKLKEQLTQPSVIVRFVNHRITILGEVKSPGTYTLTTDNLTILEGLGLAGDITDFGKRSNVKILRENNNQREIGTVNLSSKEMFTSPFYHLQQNDVVFVEQEKRKIQQQERQNLAQQIGLATSIITTIALILNFIK
ncbi:polysaccharide biosynthesis/export family protein [Flavisolibacter ginsengisoli]|jgi:polysaccharide export outer membrane protein|uniref:Polysaccharide export outer membrane protein n=1 Tax=Flavisolibacter ginsengisoli DSM 18119 TaxID=1121884 RepID=A0A1M4VEM8_9BACT|nr:polysaccharide biosynthesis/export family protein [Flavisolibacter ginsengisoli]SHE67290.1 polysaccharide export outer membrane protein [Flavisolibacter ginsengisoli DSM 18119]